MKRKNTINDISNSNISELKLSKSLEQNIQMFKNIFANDDTIRYRNIENKNQNKLKCCLIYADGMISQELVNEDIIEPIINADINYVVSFDKLLDILLKKEIISNEIKKTSNIDELIGSVLYGDTIVLFDGIAEALLIDTKGWQTRTINEPSSERIVKGPREGFVESIVINISLIRRKIRNPNLKFRTRQLGKQTKTDVCYCYIEGVANEKILKELERRLDKIDIDGILASNYIDEMIRDAPYSPFDTVGYTERPDIVAAKLLEGRFAILVDGTPSVSTLPFIFMEYFQSNEDYYNNYFFSSFNRLLRYMSFFFTTSILAIYVALVTFHQEMLPTPLILSITSAREGVPFPTIVEAFMMVIVFDILREAGVRLPEPIGATVSIVGALILGQAAVQARFVSAPIVIIVALTGISAFLVYPLKGAVIITRLVFLLLSGFLGLYGYIFGVIGLFIHLMSIRSFGIPYMINLGSINKQDLKDTAIRAPWWYMYYRPKLMADRNPVRKADAENNSLTDQNQ